VSVHRARRQACLAVLGVSLLVVPVSGDDERVVGIRPIGGLSFVDEVEVTVVNILAYVTDEDGRPVTELTADDFVVSQDGEVRPISNFGVFNEEVIRHELGVTASATPSPAGSQPDDPAEPVPPLYLAIYVDNANLHPLDRNRVLNDVRTFVRDELRPPTEMMVVSFERSVEVVQPFTDDPQQVIEALRVLRERPGLRLQTDQDRAQVMDIMQRFLEEERTLTGPAARGTRTYRDAFHRVLAVADEEKLTIAYTLDALRSVVNMLAGLPGRKAILYVSNGLPMVAGIDLFTTFANTFGDPSVYDQITRYDRSRMYNSLVAAANAQDVSFYTIDASGLELEGMISAEQHGTAAPLSTSQTTLTASIRLLADETGGFAIVNTNDFSAGLDRVARDLTTFYSVGYTLVATGADKVHRIGVEVPGHPDFTVRFRRQFVEKSLETKVQDRVLTGLVVDVRDDPIGVEARVGSESLATEGQWMVPLSVSFPVENIALLPDGDDYVGRLVVFLAARDERGRQTDVARQEHDIRVAAGDYAYVADQRLQIDTSMLMEGGTYRVVVGLMDAVTRQAGYATTSAHIGGARN
jgi:VWFA-related protein